MSSLSAEDSPSSGVCHIKNEFIVKDHERNLNTQHLAKEDLTKLEESVVSTTESGTKRIKLQPPKKLKGQNRERRANDKSQWKNKPEFCPSISEKLIRNYSDTAIANADLDLKCDKGERCKFQHDAAVYLSEKPADLGSSCYVFRLTGYCPWGISCRFGGDHLTDDGVNLIKFDDQGDASLPSKQNPNPLNKETVTKLWKKKYDFTKANSALKQTELKLKRRNPNCGDRNDDGSDGVSSVSNSAAQQDGHSHDSNGNLDKTCETLEKEMTVGEGCLSSVNISTPCDDESIQTDDKNFMGAVDDSDLIKLKQSEKKQIDWKRLLYLSPLTTVGNLPFRRICVEYGADITCSEMTLALSLLQGTREWSLVRRHPSEKIFGVQICGNNPSIMTKTAQLLEENIALDFVDINLGCPIDALYQQGCGSGMMVRKGILTRTCESMSSVLKSVPLTVKLRTGVSSTTPLAHNLMPVFRSCGVSFATVHGRSREQRYTRNADWLYIDKCAMAASPMPIYGNGDILSYVDYQRFLETAPHVSGAMIGRGALIKPWIFTEIKEQRHWDISSSERFDVIKKYVNYGLEHWGSDTRGVETTRRFLLEWLSFLYRYVPVGLLERPPQQINQRPPVYRGRDDLETLMASGSCSDWIKVSEMLLGPVPEGFSFLPKHKSNAWK